MMNSVDAFSIDANSQWVRQLFQQRGYVVPPYQRRYAWGAKQCEQLWSDLFTLLKEKGEVHFIGSVVFVQNGGDREVVDGQQRMVTLSVLFAAIVARLNELDDDRAVHVRNESLSSLDLVTKIQKPKLKLNKGDDATFRRLVTSTPILKDPKDKKSLLSELNVELSGLVSPSDSSRQLVENYEFFLQKLRDEFTDSQIVVEFYNCVLDRVQAVEILASNDEAAYRLFETLNDRGMELSVSDLIKNHLYSMTKADAEDMQKYWDRIESAIGPRRLPEFLRHNYISQNGNVQKERLFRKLKDACNSEHEAMSLVVDLQRHAELYKCLLDRSIGTDLGIPESGNPRLSVDDLLEGLAALGITASYPILISVYRVEKAGFAECLHLLVAHALRYYTLGGFQSGRMGNTYADLAKEIYAKESHERAAEILRDRLSQPGNTIGDVQFVEKFISKKDWKTAEAKWLLRIIENSERTDVVVESDLTLEHVLPQGIFNTDPSGTSEWDVYFNWTAKLHSEYVSRIGNMTLLSGPKNSALGKMSFKDKIYSPKGYNKSTELVISDSIKAASSWSPKEIEERGRILGEIAVKLLSLS